MRSRKTHVEKIEIGAIVPPTPYFQYPLSSEFLETPRSRDTHTGREPRHRSSELTFYSVKPHQVSDHSFTKQKIFWTHAELQYQEKRDSRNSTHTSGCFSSSNTTPKRSGSQPYTGFGLSSNQFRPDRQSENCYTGTNDILT